MTNDLFFILIIPVVALLWFLIGKSYNFLSSIIARMIENKRDPRGLNSPQLLNVFSAETITGAEAEFINEYLPEKRKTILVLRLTLILLYATFIIHFLSN